MLGVRDTASVEIEDLSSSKECSPVKTVIAEESLAAKRTENDHRSEEGPVLDVERNDECHSFCIFEVQGTPATKIDAHKEGDCEDTTLAFQSSGVSAGDQRLSDNNEMNFGEKILSFQEQARNSSIDWVDSEVTISNPAACKSPNNGIDLSILAESSEMDNAVEVKISPKRCFDEIGEGDKVSATAFNQARSLSSDTSGHVATQSEDMPSVGPAEHTDQLLAVKIKNENSETEFTNEEETLGCVSVFQMIPECASQSTSREQTVEIVSSVEKSQLILQASLGCRFGQYPETSGTTGTSLTRETTELEGLPNQEADEKATKIELVETTASQGLPTSPMKLAPLKCDYDATCTKSTFALSNPSVHKSLKELIHMANHKCYQVDSSKVQYKAGLSKKKTAGLPHLHERFNFHKR
ncbi:LANO_0A03884g1_1 [Lachancea nothofagi CBS 11611]|uniref:LANO_0A03884g1_1 n=1 Tax=Lachancea nothofagi CBS 11611 TaxID=1266666 RepID=A0A1G4IPZ8_9SACH|nr:LANO_0A03884g1_1 [Lachancea nothofagi CBS 11611]